MLVRDERICELKAKIIAVVAGYFIANASALIDSCQARMADASSTSATPTVVEKLVGKTKNCESGEVTLIKVTSEPYPTADTIYTGPGIKVEPGMGGDEPIEVIALGPILGSMDSPEVETELRCAKRGMVMTATITRSANFHGSALQNQTWRPIITIALVSRVPNVTFETIWRMRLTTGAGLRHAQTPPYPDQKYPITVMKTIRRHRKR
jgi:hypothetical protein